MVTSASVESVATASQRAACRFCGAALRHTLVDLGDVAAVRKLSDASQLGCMEPFYPLHVWLCDQCWLAQLQEYVSPRSIFSEYAYYSSYSDTWLAHARQFTRRLSSSWSSGRAVW